MAKLMQTKQTIGKYRSRYAVHECKLPIKFCTFLILLDYFVLSVISLTNSRTFITIDDFIISVNLVINFTMNITAKAWISPATQAQAQAQMQAIGMTQVKTKFDANTSTSTSKIIQTF